MEKAAAFQKLGPFCSKMKDPTPGKAKAFMELVPQVSPNALQSLQKGILGAFLNPILNAAVPLENKIYVLDSITQLLSHTHVSDPSVLWSTHNGAFVLIYNDAKSQTIEAHEELKLSAVKCVTTGLKQATADLLTDIYTKANVPKISKCAYICKTLVQTEKFSALRVAAINCIMTLAYVHDEADDKDVVLRQQIGDVVMFILPGTLAMLRDVIVEGETTPHKVKVIALCAWSRMIALVMQDFYARDEDLMSLELVQKQMENLQIDWNVRSKEELLKRLNASKRTRSWYQTAAEMITKSLRCISVAQVHPHWNVRKELALGCKLLVSKCSRNMEPAATYLLDILIVLANDEVEAVSLISQEGLTVFSEKLCEQTGRHLLTVVEENFYSVITSLPRVLKGVDDSKQLATLSLLIGYMKLLGKEKLSEVFLSVAHLGRFMSMLIQAFELDNVTVQLLDDCGIKEVDSVSHINTNVSWKLFKTCTYPEQLTKLVNICKLLVEYADMSMLVNYLLDLFSNSVSDRKEVTVILNELLSCGTHREFVFHVIENILDVYLEPSVWYMPLKTGYIDDNYVTIVQARSNVIQTCLLLEGVGKMIKFLGNNADPLLKKVLFPLLERAGSSHELVALFGLNALCSIATAYGHPGDAAYVINANLDYLSNTIHVKLRRSDEDISALNVLRVMTKHCTVEKLPQLKGVLEKAIKQSYGAYQTTDALLFLEVLHPLMVSLRHLKEDEITTEHNVTESLSRNMTNGEVVDELLIYHKNREATSKFKDEDSEHQVTQPLEEEEEEEQPKEKDPLTELTVSVMQRCVHLISTTNRQVTLLVLSILKEGLIVLKDQENSLLPVVHQIWAPLLTRLCDLSDHMVGRYSLQLLLVLAEKAKCFIRKRTLQKVLPHFCHFLSSNIENSRKKDHGHAYRFTQLYKLQLEMLQGLGNLAVNINLQEREIWQILEASCAYLSSWQPLPFQNASVELCVKLATLNRETVWFKLMELWCESKELQPPFEGLCCLHHQPISTGGPVADIFYGLLVLDELEEQVIFGEKFMNPPPEKHKKSTEDISNRLAMM